MHSRCTAESWWRDEHDRAPAARDVVHLAEALALELGVADGEHLVDEQDVGVEVRGDREGEAHVHAAGVALDRACRGTARCPRTRRSRRSVAAISLAAHAEDRAAEEDVLAAGQLGMEAGADLEQRAHAAGELDAPLGRRRDPREHLQQRRLAGAVAARSRPTTSPRSTSNETSRSAQNSLPPWARRAPMRSLSRSVDAPPSR